MNKGVRNFFIAIGAFVVLAAFMGMSNNDVEPVEKKIVSTREKYEMIKQGDSSTGEGGSSEKEVISLLGEPENEANAQIKINGKLYNTSVVTWITKDFETIVITFRNDGVVSKSFTK
ncbi:hypothetical protein CPT_Silence39 [Bacillus phage Silence]|nr:hypothetical protein CPT_Silence39 [Bacillus phage Silence]